jgi:hypothetical protein
MYFHCRFTVEVVLHFLLDRVLAYFEVPLGARMPVFCNSLDGRRPANRLHTALVYFSFLEETRLDDQ